MTTKIVAFGNRAEQGKDECVKTIIGAYSKFHNFTIKRYAFADAVKRESTAAIEAWGGPDGFFRAWNAGIISRGFPARPAWVVQEPNPPMDDPLCPNGKFRTLLQFWGTQYRRAQDPSYWVKALSEQLLLEGADWALISDLRFVNEYNWVKAWNGTTIRVIREGHHVASNHISEWALAAYPFDYTITAPFNDIIHLRCAAMKTFDKIMRKHV